MKIRMEGSSVRLRLRRTEVAQIGAGERLVEKVVFPDGVWTYSLVPEDGVQELSARMTTQGVDIILPAKLAASWAHSEQVGFENWVGLPGGSQLHLLVEKDFVCLDRDLESQKDHYPNPKADVQGC
ncbi:DUF7009 family protein [Robiginitalea sediminis]|uniref:DUF7009 family protein n=1 Tax=Robiginitalea sediminis TaxID=1982593 RepID=UPI00117B0A05|nr:hypothetical protein [Robiginitalea sediminis]